MANALTWNPLLIDTAAATAAVTSRIAISKIRWVSKAGAEFAEDDIASIKDKNSNPVWRHQIEFIGTTPAVVIDNIESDFSPALIVDGLIVDVLGGGELYIYLDRTQSDIPVKTT